MALLNWSQQSDFLPPYNALNTRSLGNATLGKAAVFSERQFTKSYLQALLPAARRINPLVLKGDLSSALQHPLQKDWTLIYEALSRCLNL